MDSLIASLRISPAARTRWVRRCLIAALLAPAMPIICNAQSVSTAFVSAKPGPAIVRSGQLITDDDYAPTNTTALFPGDRTALQKFLRQPGMYPHVARQMGLEGTVKVQFRVLPDGTLTEHKIVQSAGRMLDQAALRMLSRMPNWLPAYRDSRAVGSLVVLPILFQLD